MTRFDLGSPGSATAGQLVALLQQDVPSAGARVIMTSCFFEDGSEEHEEHAAATLGREKAMGRQLGPEIATPVSPSPAIVASSHTSVPPSYLIVIVVL